MPEWAVTVGGWAVQVVTFGGALLAIYRWFAAPLKLLKVDVSDIKQDTGDLLGDRLTQAHDHFLAQGYCAQGDKVRLCIMYERYKRMGRNHLVETYMQDICELPEQPAGKEVRI